MTICRIDNCYDNIYANNVCRKHYDKIRRENRKKDIFNYLGGKCKSCGVGSNLQIDHINPLDKSYNITEKLLINIDTLKQELNKCQLLCRDCHNKKTNLDYNHNSLIHGTVNMYINGKCRCDLCRAEWNKYYSPIKKNRRITMMVK